MRNTIELEFADGVYRFALPLPRIDELQRKCGAGIGTIFGRVLKGCHEIGDELLQSPTDAAFHAIDLVETIRQGLIGGNHAVVNDEEIQVSAPLANRLVENYVLTRPLSDAWRLAASILGAVIVGFDDKKKEAETPLKTTVAD